VAAAELKRWTAEVFRRLDVRDEDAALVADTLVEADLRGVTSHGVQRVPQYVEAIRRGAVVPRPEIAVVRDSGWALVIDGGQGLGQIAAQAAMRLALQRAADGGHGAVAVRNSTHCGALAYYVMQAAARRCIGFGSTSAGINMMPAGGREKLVGNNPLAYAFPTGRAFPLVVDMATSVAAGGKVDAARLAGVPIPLGWAVDKDGNPTTDPSAARDGALVPVGGPKGYALAVALDVLCGALSGGRFGRGLGGPGSSHFFEAFQVEAFSPYDEFVGRMGALIDQLHACPPAEGASGVMIPGEIEHNLSTKRLAEGITLQPALVDGLRGIAGSLDMAPILA
jgi:LDH2 family malate/lactate/ureidoglycolate dehydrogenase